MKNYYDILGVPQDAPLSEIKKIYRKLVKVWHPDRFTDIDEKQFAEEKLKEINEVYRILSDENDREKYDKKLKEQYKKEQEATIKKPKLIVSTNVLDFDKVEQSKTVSQTFWIDNQGGPGKNLSIKFIPENSEDFFKLKIIPKSKEAGKEFPIKFEVILNSHDLSPGKSYSWGIIISLDNETAEVIVLVRNVFRKPAPAKPVSPKPYPKTPIISPTITPPIVSKKNNVLEWSYARLLLWFSAIGSPIILFITGAFSVDTGFKSIFILIIILAASATILGIYILAATRNLKYLKGFADPGGQAMGISTMVIGGILTIAVIIAVAIAAAIMWLIFQLIISALESK
ncbi:MAG: J domain-containing protein [Candidatus Shapirobacteria bacterium]|nr:J domain-containing protein [Candidatus Shapirobacteria bacterium]